MSDENLDQLLAQHGLRKTAFRKEILGIFHRHSGRAISHLDIEDALEEWDRITLYRTLKSFEDKGLIHQTPGVSGSARFALCGQSCSAHRHDDSHAHFHCTRCDETLCLQDAVETLSYNLPENYKLTESKVLLEGICASCN